ncbi:ROK family protein [Paenibacillus sp. GCM10027627]|uniref:ROK family protein n=1 Tax=unclassified Paenibacillus TaxID=185978 RepID=UPI0036360B3F
MNHYVGIEIYGDKIGFIAETPDGLMEYETSIEKDCSLEFLQNEVEQFMARLPIVPKGIGMGMPGLVAGTYKVELSHVVPALSGVTAEQFATSNGIPVAFINDVKASTLAEAAYRQDRDTVAVIMVDTYIASGVVVKGELLLGAKGWSGELGYMLMSVDGKPTALDFLASGYAIANQAGVDIDTLHHNLEQGDEHSVAIVRHAGTFLGYSLANLLHLYNPDVIVLGGSTPTLHGYREAAIAALEAHALPELLKCCSIEAPKIERKVIAHGAKEWARKLTLA